VLVQQADRTSRRVAEIGKLLRKSPFGPPVELKETLLEAAAEGNFRRPPSPVTLNTYGSLPAVPLWGSLLRARLVRLLRDRGHAGTAARRPRRGPIRRGGRVAVTA